MALIKFGIVVAEARGKLNGGVFSKGAAGNVLRTKVTPVNPASSAQQGVRSGLTAIAQAWRGLTVAQRAGWKALATQVTTSNIFGDNVTLSGLAMSGRVNRNRQAIAQVILADAPALPTLSALTALSVTATAGTPTLSVVYAPTPVPTGHTMVLRFTPQMSAGRSFVKGKFVQLAIVAAAAATPYNALAVYTARFGTLVAGQRITVSAHYIHIASGFATLPITASVVIAA
jgi:hypothetical protein